jgi:hypothetical protein
MGERQGVGDMVAILVVLAVFLFAATVSALLASARMTSKGRVKHWNGESISVGASQKRYARIRGLRLAAGLCILLLAVDAVAIYTLASYVAVR